jgi:hypothetical protein
MRVRTFDHEGCFGCVTPPASSRSYIVVLIILWYIYSVAPSPTLCYVTAIELMVQDTPPYQSQQQGATDAIQGSSQTHVVGTSKPAEMPTANVHENAPEAIQDNS